MTDTTPVPYPYKQAHGRRTGRPTKLDQVVWVHPDGTEQTTGDRIIASIEAGFSVKDACTEAGIDKSTLHTWRTRGALARQQDAEGTEVPETERPFADFLTRLERAHLTFEMVRLARIDKAASEPQTVTKVTIKKALNDAGEMVEVERSEVTEERPALWTADGWLLERIRPHKYGRRMDMTVTPGDASNEERAASLNDQLDAYLQGHADATAHTDQPIDVTVVDE